MGKKSTEFLHNAVAQSFCWQPKLFVTNKVGITVLIPAELHPFL